MNASRSPQKGWRTLFPLVRYLSCALTPQLLRLNVPPNQVTTASLILGLGCAACYSFGDRAIARAIGAQVYWILALVEGARRYHV